MRTFRARLRGSLPFRLKSNGFAATTRRAVRRYEKLLHNYQCYILHLPYMQLQETDFDEGTT